MTDNDETDWGDSLPLRVRWAIDEVLDEIHGVEITSPDGVTRREFSKASQDCWDLYRRVEEWESTFQAGRDNSSKSEKSDESQ